MATILFDTHALLWWLTGNRRLPETSRKQIEDGENLVLISAVSAWEISIKRALGKLEAPDDLITVARSSGLEWIAIEPTEAYAAGQLPMHHRDPFDRLLVAQARSRKATLLSGDETLDLYGGPRIWA